MTEDAAAGTSRCESARLSSRALATAVSATASAAAVSVSATTEAVITRHRKVDARATMVPPSRPSHLARQTLIVIIRLL